MAVWTQVHRDEIERAEAQSGDMHFVAVGGCGSPVIYACQSAAPAAPRCYVATAARPNLPDAIGVTK